MSPVAGRRLPDHPFGAGLPEGARPGDIWRLTDAETGEPLSARAYCNAADPASPVHQNLTDEMWGYLSPDGAGDGLLAYHTVRSEEDGTVSIRPGDGSSNSVLHVRRGADGEHTWHGFVEHCVWTPV